MSLTMPRKYPHAHGPAGERRVFCDYCGIKWYRSDLRRDPAGYLACPDDRDGRDIVTLDRENQRYAEKAARRRPASRD